MPTSEAGRFLLDSHTFLWLASDESRVPTATRRRLADPAAERWLSTATIWELAIKRSLGKLATALPLADLVAGQCEMMAVTIIEVTKQHALAVEALPFHHRDPFDRMLIAQAIAEGLSLVSRDQEFDLYPVDRVW